MATSYQGAFNSGEHTPLLDGQKDLDKRSSSCRYILNLLGTKHGPLTRRGGTKFLKGVKFPSKRTALVRFQYSNGDNYQLEIGDLYIRFYKNRNQITSGGSVYEIATPYLQADLFDSNNVFQIHIWQSADVLYLYHPLYKTRSLSRLSDTNWTLASMEFNDGPYLDINTTTTTLTSSATTGATTITASAVTGINGDQGFLSTDVGRIIRFKDPAGNWGWMIVSGVTSTTSITASIQGAGFSAGTGTTNWRLGIFSDTTGWPVTCSYHQGRLVMGGAAFYPDRIDFTKSGGYSNTTFFFAPTNAAGAVADDNGFSETLGSDQVNRISGLISDTKGLIVCTTAEEWLIDSASTDAVLTPSNKKASPMSRTGAYRIQPIRVDTGSLFVQNRRRRVFDVIYSFEQDRQRPRDITLLCEHITRGGVIQIGYLQEPYNCVLILLNTGVLISMVYYPEQKVFGASRLVFGGRSDTTGSIAKVESFCITSDPSGERDELTLIVNRHINGLTSRTVEYMTRWYEDDIAQEDAFHVDCGITYDGVPTTTITGLVHLEAETVKVMVDGKATSDKVVSGGQITLSKQGSVVQVGLANPWAFEPARPEVPTQSGQTSLMAIKRINRIVVRVLNTLGLRYGHRDNGVANVIEYDFNNTSEFDTVTPLYSGDTDELTMESWHERDAVPYFEHDGVFPATIVALRMEGKVNE